MCEYCECKDDEDMGETPIMEIDDGNAIEMIVDDVFLYAYCVCGQHTVAKINYCPMCGRKL